MPFKELSRRTLLTASSALAFFHTPFARTLSARQSVNINDYNPHDWITSSKQALSEGQMIVVPGGLACDSINTGISIPSGKMLHILGSLHSSGRERFVLQDGSQVTGEEDGSIHSITLDVHGFSCTIKGLAMSGFGPVTQIYVDGKNKRVIRNLTVNNPTVSHTSYAILRQGLHDQTIGANITNYKFSDLQDDAIEWNVTINNRDILISDHAIERINCTNSRINWDIGIGLAGSTYDNNYPEDRIAKNFVVANITGSGCRQLIYVKNSKHFVIHSTKARNITPDFSKKASINNATIAIHGCGNFVTDSIEIVSSTGMSTDYEVIRGRCLSIPQNFRVGNIQLDNTHLAYKLHGIQISTGNAISFVTLTNIEMKRASLESHNKPQYLFMRSISVTQESSVGLALSINFDMRKDVHDVFMTRKETLLFLANVHAVNGRGQSFVDIDKVNHHIVNVEKINFRLPKWRE